MYAALDAAPTSFFLAFGDSVQSSLFFLFTRAQHSCDFGFSSCFLFNSFFFFYVFAFPVFFFFHEIVALAEKRCLRRLGVLLGRTKDK